MSSTIATLAGNTGLGSERQIIWAVNSANYWAFGYTGTSTLATWYSPDGSSWTAGATHTLSNVHNSEGRNLAVAYKNISGVDVVQIGFPWSISTSVAVNAIRATISGTTLTFHSVETAVASGTTDGGSLDWAGSGLEFDSNNKIHFANGFAGGGNGDVNSSDSTADGGTPEQMTPVTWTSHVIDSSVANETRSAYVVDLGSGNAGLIADDGSGHSTATGLDWHKWNGTSWNVDNTNGKVTGGTITAIDKNDWGAVAVSASDVHAVYRNASGSLIHRRYNGTSWGAGQSIPSQNSLAGGGVALMSDGASVWLCVIDTDSANTIRYIRWSSQTTNGIADTWDTNWQAAETSSQTRTWIGCPRDVQSQTGLVYWSEGSSFVAVTFQALPPEDPVGAWIQSNQGSTGTAATTFAVTFTTQNVVAGHRIIVAISAWNASATTVTSVTDSASNQYAKDKDAVESDNTHISIWSAPITGGGGTKPTVTAHASASTNEWAMWVHEYSGLLGGTAGYLDGTNSHVATATSPFTSGASTPVPGAANEIAFGFYGDGGNNVTTIGVSSGWTQRGTSIQGTSSTAEGACEDQVTVAGTGSNASFTLSTTGNPAGALVAVYKLAISAIGIGQMDPSGLSPFTLPSSPYAQMLWLQPLVVAAPSAAAVVSTFPILNPRRIVWALRRGQALRGTGFAPIPAADVPLATVRMRTRAAGPLRHHPADIPWYQAAANTNQPLFTPPTVRPRRPFGWLRRGRGAQMPGPAGDGLGQAPQRPRLRLAWLRRGRGAGQALVQAGDGPVPQQRSRSRLAWLRRARAGVGAVPAAPPVDGPRQTASRRPRAWLRRRLAAFVPPPVVVVVNPAFADWVRRRVLQRFWTQPRKGRYLEPGWGQAAVSPNPSFVDWARRRVLQRFWTKQPKGRSVEPPWGQAAPNTNQPQYVTSVRLRRAWSVLRRRPPVQVVEQQIAVQPRFGLRRLWAISRRRAAVQPTDQQAPVVQPRSSRRPSVQPRRVRAVLQPFAIVVVPAFVDWVRRRLSPRFWPIPRRGVRQEPGWGQATSSVPLQPIALTIVTRSMGLLVGTRDMVAQMLTRSLFAVAKTRDMIATIITRSGSSRPNTRG